MEDTQVKTEQTTTPAQAPVTEGASGREQNDTRHSARGARGGRGGRPERRAPRRDRNVKPEFDSKIVSLRRVTRVVSGGRRFSFSVALVAGNRKGQVGVGFGKATDTPLAIDKALRDAKKNMITVNRTHDNSVPHEVEAKFAASVVKIRPAPGRGILAGSSVRTVLELAGLTNVGAKLLSRSKNSANNALVAVKALKKLEHTKIRTPKN
jgi:small subunit ribosomal protein S5